MDEALDRMLATWKGSARPKIHFSSARTEMRETARRNRKTGKSETVLQPPLCTQHGDYANAFEFCTFMREHPGREFDVMLESKAKDLALLRLRRDMLRFAPDVAARFGIRAEAAGDEPEEICVVAGEFGNPVLPYRAVPVEFKMSQPSGGFNQRGTCAGCGVGDTNTIV